MSKALPTAAGPGDPFGVAYLGGSPYSAQALGGPKLGLTRDVYDGNLTVNWGFADGWNLTLVNGYREFDSREIFDADGSAAPFLEFAEIATGYQFNQETRIAYTSDTFRGSFGFNYFYEKNRQNVPFSTEEGVYLQCAARLVPGLACVAPNGTVAAAGATAILTGGKATAIPYTSVFENQGKNDAYSVFADATYIPTPALELTGGARFLIEKRRSGFFANVPRSVITGGASLIPGQVDTRGQTFTTEDSFIAVLPRANLLYKITPNLNVYATASKGRRSPTVQLGAASTANGPIPAITSVLAENVWNYEVGAKFASEKVSGSIGAYYLTYDNFQVSIIQPNGTTLTQSAGSATNKGVEAELTLRPTKWFSVFGNIGYIDGGIDNNPQIAANFRGAKFRLQPEVQASGGFTVDVPLGNGLRVFATPTVTHRSKIFFEIPNLEAISQAPVTLVNVRAGVGFEVGGKQIEVFGYARNLLDKNYLLDAGNTGGAFGIPSFIKAEPRLYGVQASVRF